MLIICPIDLREVGVAFELQCLRNCTLSSCVYFVLITVCDLIIVHVDWLYIDLFAGVQCVLSVIFGVYWMV